MTDPLPPLDLTPIRCLCACDADDIIRYSPDCPFHAVRGLRAEVDRLRVALAEADSRLTAIRALLQMWRSIQTEGPDSQFGTLRRCAADLDATINQK